MKFKALRRGGGGNSALCFAACALYPQGPRLQDGTAPAIPIADWEVRMGGRGFRGAVERTFCLVSFQGQAGPET